jgi:hypothetical protein
MNKKKSQLTLCHGRNHFKKTLSSAVLVLMEAAAYAQQTGNGVAGLQQANTLVGSYFDYAVYLMYSIGAVVGVVGAVKVYNAWSHGDQQTNKMAASWFGACIFLVVVAAVLKSFFGVS